ncbi:hypothetical protein Gohar_027338 [Gossypium harknessii]|uniref:Uncharacterized protein n=1 Tax=Gossypium harknessii TaxID=34285 RepID=A0A7J9HUH3_9ROSI|nr:hypothetical protein [Gossypium harknessii]
MLSAGDKKQRKRQEQKLR